MHISIRPKKEDVRRQAFMVLAEKIDIKAISIEDRIAVLRAGLGDRNGELRATESKIKREREKE